MGKWKNGFFAKIAWHYLCQEGKKSARFRAHYLFLAKILLDQDSKNQENYKNSGFSGNCPKPKWHLCLKKKAFLTWVKKWVLLAVFFWKHYFYSGFSKTQQLQQRSYMLKNRPFMKNSGLFLNMARRCFCLFFFQALMLLWFGFCVSGKVATALNMLVFFQFYWLLWGGLILFIWVSKV